MEVRVGEWYLCEGYIDEPVQIRSVESNRIEIRYLGSNKQKWLGYPKIWQACKPHRLPDEVQFDAETRTIRVGGAGAAQSMSLAQLRAAHLPRTHKPRPQAAKPAAAPKPAPVLADAFGLDWSGDDGWGGETEEAGYELEAED